VNLGEAAAQYAPDILNILKDETVDSSVRSGAARVLGNLGEAAAQYVPDILNFLKDETVDSSVRIRAVRPLENLREIRGVGAFPDTLRIIDENVGSSVRPLRNLGEAAAQYVPDILNILKDENVSSLVRSGVAYALKNLGEARAKYVPDILNFLKNENVDPFVRRCVVEILAKEEAGVLGVPDILNILKDENVDSSQCSISFGEYPKTRIKRGCCRFK
jgi:HEAT repeat protein